MMDGSLAPSDGCSARVVRPKLEETKSKLPELSDEAMDGTDEQNWRGLYLPWFLVPICWPMFQGFSKNIPIFFVVISLGFFGFCGY